ncbi:MAG: hypothetical protein LBH95_06650 [Oscillospiraceae bacterium]|nr:hypothetical protein [Oscillospiraceae bacterium]
MAKAGMRRPGEGEPHGTESNQKTPQTKNEQRPVAQMPGAKSKNTHKK